MTECSFRTPRTRLLGALLVCAAWLNPSSAPACSSCLAGDPIFSSAFYRVNTRGNLQYEYGDTFLANAAVLVPLRHAASRAYLDPFTLGFEANFRWADFDSVAGAHHRDSGGSILYLTPSLSARLPWPWEQGAPSLRGSVQIPLTSSFLAERVPGGGSHLVRRGAALVLTCAGASSSSRCWLARRGRTMQSPWSDWTEATSRSGRRKGSS